MPGISDVRICNIALSRLGAKRITSLTEDSTNARACNAIYQEIRDDVLTEHPWSFAQKRVALSLLDEDPVWTEDGVTEVYSKPPDLLKLNFTNSQFALVKLEGNKILSNVEDLQIKYTFRNTDTAQYFSKFITALATRLAGELAYTLTKSRSVAESLLKDYEELKLPSAMSQDSMQGTPLQAIQDNWLVARISGGANELVGRSGFDTFYPANWIY